MSIDPKIAVAIYEGVQVSGIVEIKDRSSFTNDAGQTMQLIAVSTNGFSKKFISQDESEVRAWPQKGQFAQMEVSLSPAKDNSYKLGTPVFTAISPKGQPA